MQFIVLLLACLIATTTVAGAAPKITKNTKYYSIRGSTSAELKREMSRRGPPNPDNPSSRFWGLCALERLMELQMHQERRSL